MGKCFPLVLDFFSGEGTSAAPSPSGGGLGRSLRALASPWQSRMRAGCHHGEQRRACPGCSAHKGPGACGARPRGPARLRARRARRRSSRAYVIMLSRTCLSAVTKERSELSARAARAGGAGHPVGAARAATTDAVPRAAARARAALPRGGGVQPPCPHPNLPPEGEGDSATSRASAAARSASAAHLHGSAPTPTAARRPRSSARTATGPWSCPARARPGARRVRGNTPR
jgi:hypothetical protein